jgi:hypothetical protein
MFLLLMVAPILVVTVLYLSKTTSWTLNNGLLQPRFLLELAFDLIDYGLKLEGQLCIILKQMSNPKSKQ